MRRREFIMMLGGASVARSLPSLAQQAKRLPVVGLVAHSVPLAEMAGSDPIQLTWRAIVHSLRDFGWIDGRTVVIERRSAEGDPRRAPAILAELLARGADVLVLPGARWLQDIAQQATRTVPIVASFSEDPVASGQIASLSRPGGNMTGVTATTGPEFFGKRLQLLQELAPRITRVAFVASSGVLEQYRSVTRLSGVTVVPVQLDLAAQIDGAFAAISRERADALMVASSGITYLYFRRFVTFAADTRLPTNYGTREPVDAGGLMSYGPSAQGVFRDMARQVDKFLRGAKVGEVPAEQPTAFEVVINAKTAKWLGLAIPPTLLARADEIID